MSREDPQLAPRRFRAESGCVDEHGQRLLPALLCAGAERRHAGEPDRSIRVPVLCRVRQQLRALPQQIRRTIADDQAFAELGHGYEVVFPRRGGKRVDRFVVTTFGVTLRGKFQPA